MSAQQIFIALVGSVALFITIWAILSIVKTPDLRLKPLWIFGSLFAFFGFTINWTAPGDLYFWFGVQIPFFSVFKFLGSGEWIAKVGFPIVAIVALAKFRRKKAVGAVELLEP